MKTFNIQKEILIQKSLKDVFDFFSNAANLQKLTPSWLHFEILTPLPIQIQKGTLIDYRIRIHRLPVKWQTKITKWEPPFRFIDEQIKGPYRLWIHEHRFEETPEGVKVTDIVEYAPPFGWLANELFVKHDLKRIFDFGVRHWSRSSDRQIYGNNLFLLSCSLLMLLPL